MNASLGTEIFAGQSFRDAAGDPLSLGYVVTKLAGTATLQATYADSTLSTPNANSATLASTLRLDAGGFPTSSMYFAPVPSVLEAVAYDVYLYDADENLIRTIQDVVVPVPSAGGNATSVVVGYGEATTLTIAGGAITPIHNIHKVAPEGGTADNLDNIAVTNLPDGAPLVISNTSGSAAITVRNGVGNIFTGSGNSVVLTGTSQRLMLARYGSNWFQITTPPESATLGNGNAQGRLTLTTGVPVTTTDVTAAGTLYWTPFRGNTIDLYDGVSSWTRYTFGQLSLALSVSSGGIYDVFAYNNAGTVALQLSSPWTLNVRTNAIGLQNGVYVLAGDTRLRYLGTICASGTNVCEDSYAKRFVWNYYNRVPRPVRVIDATASWNYSSGSYRQANGSATNQVSTVVGISEDAFQLTATSIASSNAVASQVFSAIGLNSTTPIANVIGGNAESAVAAVLIQWTAVLNAPTVIGKNDYLWLEAGDGADTQTWFGVSTGLWGTVLG